jgi:rhomboid protease GluP
MFKRQRTGSVICTHCGKLVGVRDPECYNCGGRNPGLFGFSPLLRNLGHDLAFPDLVVFGCAALYLAMLLVDVRGIQMNGMSILGPSVRSLFFFGASGSLPVYYYGRWWTLLSAAWLHANLLHIVFNMMWVRQLAPATSELYGSARTVIIYTLASICGFLLSSSAGLIFGWTPLSFLQGARFTVGASAPIFGLLGALVVYGRRGGSSHISNQALTYAIIMFVFGFVMPGIDNYAHLGGFAGGFAAASYLDPLRPERINHIIIAGICLFLTAISVLLSLLQGRLF